MKKNLNIVVVGCGAIGGIVAAELKRNKFNVQLITKYEDSAKQVSTKGVHISGVHGSHWVKMPALSKASDLKIKPDIVMVATKAPDMATAVKEILPFLKEDSMVVSLQNGIVIDELASLVGNKRTVGCVVGWGATMIDKCHMKMTSTGEFVIGYPDREPDQKLEELRKIMCHIVPVETTDIITNYLYSKLIINSCTSTIGAICGLPLGQMLKKKVYRNMFLSIMKEAIDVSEAMGLHIPKYAGKADYYKIVGWPKYKQYLFMRAFGFKYRRLKSSSLQSLERGKKTEVRYFNGYIASKGKENNIATPVNDRLITMIEEIERGDRKIGKENFGKN